MDVSDGHSDDETLFHNFGPTTELCRVPIGKVFGELLTAPHEFSQEYTGL